MKKLLIIVLVLLCSSIVFAFPDLKGGNLTTLTNTYVEYNTLIEGTGLNATIKLNGTGLISKISSCDDFYFNDSIVRISPAFDVVSMEIDVPRNLSGGIYTNPVLYHCADLTYNESNKNCTSGWETYKRDYKRVVSNVTGLKITDFFSNVTVPKWLNIPNYTVTYVPNFKVVKDYDIFYFDTVNSTYTVGPGQNYTTLVGCLNVTNNTGDACNIVVNGTYISDGNNYMWYMNDSSHYIDIQSDDVVLNCNGSVFNSNLTGIGIYASNHINNTIMNCNLTGFDTGILFDHMSNSSIHNNFISIFYIYGSSYNGVDVSYSPYVNVYNNLFFVPMNVSNISVLNAQNRLYAEYSPYINISNNTIKAASMEVKHCENSTIENNVLSNFGINVAELNVESSSNSIIKNNIINNTIGLLGGLAVSSSDNVIIEGNSVQDNFLLLSLFQNDINLSIYNNVFEGTPNAWYLKNISNLSMDMFGVNCFNFTNSSGLDPKSCELSFSVLMLQSLLGGSGMNLTGGNISNVNMDILGLTGGSIGAITTLNVVLLNFTNNLLKYDGFKLSPDINGVDNIYFKNDYLGMGLAAASFDADNATINDNNFIMKDSGLDFKLNGNTSSFEDTVMNIKFSPLWISGSNNKVYNNSFLASYARASLTSDSLINITVSNFGISGELGGILAKQSIDSSYYNNIINFTSSGVFVNLYTPNITIFNFTFYDSQIGGIILDDSIGNNIWNNSIYIDDVAIDAKFVSKNIEFTNSSMNNVNGGLILLSNTNNTIVWNNTGRLNNARINITMNGSTSSIIKNVDLSDVHFGLVTVYNSNNNTFMLNNFILGSLGLFVPFYSLNPEASFITSHGSSFAFYNLVGSNYNNITQTNVSNQILSPMHISGLTNLLVNSSIMFPIDSIYIVGNNNDISHNIFENNILNGSLASLAGVNSSVVIYEASLNIGNNSNSIYLNDFKDITNYGLIDTGLNNIIVKNDFLSGQMLETNPTLNTYCSGANGNFYIENVTPVSGDCGPISTFNVNVLGDNYYNVSWKAQSSNNKVIRYIVYLNNNNISDSLNTYLVLPMGEDINNIKVIPYFDLMKGTHVNYSYYVPIPDTYMSRIVGAPFVMFAKAAGLIPLIIAAFLLGLAIERGWFCILFDR